MNNKTETRIENMKRQTIGVEIEMAGITRKAAIKVIAKHFNTEETIQSCGDSYDRYTCEDNQGRTWQIMRDSSIQTTWSKQTELVTPILHYEDIETLQELVRVLRKKGAKSNPDLGCGVHIHIGADGHNAKTLRNLVNIMASHEPLIKEALNLDSGRIAQYCQMVNKDFLKRLNKNKPTRMSDLADLWYEDTWGSRSAHYNPSRYHMLNLHATFTKGTIEFRLFQFDNPSEERKGGLHAGQLKSYIQFCLALSQMAKEAKSASPKPQQNDNPKYAMRTWLLRLGFIGEEFKTARETLTKRLSGNAAFRQA